MSWNLAESHRGLFKAKLKWRHQQLGCVNGLESLCQEQVSHCCSFRNFHLTAGHHRLLLAQIGLTVFPHRGRSSWVALCGTLLRWTQNISCELNDYYPMTRSDRSFLKALTNRDKLGPSRINGLMLHMFHHAKVADNLLTTSIKQGR